MKNNIGDLISSLEFLILNWNIFKSKCSLGSLNINIDQSDTTSVAYNFIHEHNQNLRGVPAWFCFSKPKVNTDHPSFLTYWTMKKTEIDLFFFLHQYYGRKAWMQKKDRIFVAFSSQKFAFFVCQSGRWLWKLFIMVSWLDWFNQ